MTKKKLSMQQMIDEVSGQLFAYLKQVLQDLPANGVKDEKLVLYAMEKFVALAILDLKIDPEIYYEHLVAMVKQMINEDLRAKPVLTERVEDRYTVH